MIKKIVAFVSAACIAVCSAACLVCSADNNVSTNGLTIEEDSRFTPLGIGKKVADLSRYIVDVYKGLWTDTTPNISNMIGENSVVMSKLVNMYLHDYANNSTTGSYTIQDSYSFVAKRKILYPYDNMEETDYLICFVDKNNTYQVQEFGDYYIAPNSLLMIRQCNWEDTPRILSIPIDENNITINIGNYGGLFELRLGTPTNAGGFIIADDSGLEYFPFRHTTSWNESGMLVQNNGYNNIYNTNLQTTYNSDPNFYNLYVDGQNNAPLNDFEAFIGTGYNYDYSQGLMSGAPGSWFITSGYLNISGSNNYFLEHTNNNIVGTVNPKYSPVYIVPNDSPFKSGQTLNENTVNNYNDYGITYNSNTNEFELDVAALGAALGAAIVPEIQGLINGTFALQPEIGADFDLSPSLDFNYLDLLTDYISQITVTVDTERPMISTISTYTTFDFGFNIVSTTYTLSASESVNSQVLWGVGERVLTACGLTVSIIAFVTLIGLLVWLVF